ncbi:glycosyltransferase family 2 protein [Clostridium psychrophilum]|uniref:glycosyltransferase family 2 protein n=1 Tax=Clostridium psychrophilum TaxID=132926 RepID=UPI001C0C45A3|nr:glycosyltransferase [Clostridium psychrophilum]MBU3180687.1 glycosyltransferase [Clostridium psychrophilum]
MNDLLSVVVPIYNVGNYLDECIKSIINQTYANLEIILVNDGSTDNSLDICKKYSKADTRIVLIDKKNGGLADARNAGITVFTGNFIAFIDSDDIINLKMFELMLGLINKTKSDIAICSYTDFSDDKPINNRKLNEHHNVTYTGKDAVYNVYTGRNKNIQFIAWNKIYKRELFTNIRYPIGKLHEDEFVTYKVLYYAKKVVCSQAILYYYRQREKSIMHTTLSYRNLNSLEAYQESIDFFAQRNEKILCSCAVNRALASTIVLYNRFAENQIYDKKIEQEIKKYYSKIIHKYLSNTDLSKIKKTYYRIFYINCKLGLLLFKLKNINK